MTAVACSASGFCFELLRAQDLPMLHRWLLQPHVAQWWGPADTVEQLHADYVPGQGAPDATLACIASLHGAPVGFIQSYVAMGSGDGWWEDVTDPGVRGIDQLNQGIGRAMVRCWPARRSGCRKCWRSRSPLAMRSAPSGRRRGRCRSRPAW